MPLKRAKDVDDSSLVKRSKPMTFVNFEPGNWSAKKKNITSKELSFDDSEEEELLIRNYKPKQPQPKPKKKVLSETSTPVQELVNNKPLAHAPKEIKKSTNSSAILSNQNKKIVNFPRGNQENQEHHIRATSNSNTTSKINAKSNSNGAVKSVNKNIGNNSSNDSNSTIASKTKDDKKASLKPSKATSSMSPEQLAAAYEELNAKYKRLKQLRETEAEKNLNECLAKLEESTRSAENYRAQTEPQLESGLRIQEKLRASNEELNANVRLLQRKVRDYEEKIRKREQEDKAKEKIVSMESVLASPDVTPSSAGALSTIKMIENLSGFKTIARDIFPRSSKDTIPKVWDCEHSGPRGTLRFTLTYDYTTNKVSYCPILDRKKDEELIRLLPDYLTDELEFNREFESKFFWRVLNFNHEGP
ncbi:hypothetical protein BGZ46_001274 [Entomortierella lignicola]|nr:hypothetical protein BGZ46_001274 [Entomortierella lignicola]